MGRPRLPQPAVDLGRMLGLKGRDIRQVEAPYVPADDPLADLYFGPDRPVYRDPAQEHALRNRGRAPGVYRDPGQEGATAGRMPNSVELDQMMAEERVARRRNEELRLLARRDALMRGTTLGDEQAEADLLRRRDALMGADLDGASAAYANQRRQAPVSDPLEEVAKLHVARPRVGFDAVARRRR